MLKSLKSSNYFKTDVCQMYNLSIHFIVYSPIDTFQDFLIAHETTYAYIGNKHFFDKSCHRQTFQNSKISCQKMCSNLLKIWSFQKNANNNILNWYSSRKKNWKDSDNFRHRKFTLKVRNWHFLSADFRVFGRSDNDLV